MGKQGRTFIGYIRRGVKMKAIVKKYFQEFIDYIDVPSLIYIYETGKIIACNNLATDIIGKGVTSFNKLWMESQRMKLDEEVLSQGSKIFYSKKQWHQMQGVVDIDIEINVIELDNVHLIICFLDYSYKQSFARHAKLQLPRMVYVDKKMHYISSNLRFREDINLPKDSSFPIPMVEIFDEDTTEKLREDNLAVLTTKKPQYHRIQLLRQEQTFGYMTTLNRIPVINKNGTAIGVLIVYNLIFNREEYKRFYDVALRENNIMSQIISRSETMILNWRKDIKFHVEYVSSNINRCGFTASDVYEERVHVTDVVIPEYHERLYEKVHMLESGVKDYFEMELPIAYKQRTVSWVKIHVGISRRSNHNYYFECLIQDITEKKKLEFQLKSNEEILRVYKKYETLYDVQLHEPEETGFLPVVDLQQKEKEDLLVKALNHGLQEFEVYYQPIVGGRDQKLVGVEALLRWRSPQIGLVNPKDFLNITKYRGLLLPLANYAMTEAIKGYKKMCKSMKHHPKLHLNISLIQLVERGFVGELMELLVKYRIDPTQVVLEIKESLAVEDIKLMQSLIAQFHQIGLKVALENFGAGFISIQHVLGMSLDYIKLDKQLISEYPSGEFDSALVKALLDMIQSIHIDVIITGVESKEQLEFMNLHKVYAYQGYYIGEAVPLAELIENYNGEI